MIAFYVFFETLGAKNTVKPDVCYAAEAQNHSIYDVFWPSVANITVFVYSVFRPAPGKNTSIYAVFSMFFPTSLYGVLVFDFVSRLLHRLRFLCPTTTLSHIIFHTQLCHTHNFCHTLSFTQKAGVALGDIHLRLAWQAWHLVTCTFVLSGRRGTYGTGLALVARLGRI